MATEHIRTFIAVELPDMIKKQVESLENRLMKARANIKWVSPHNIHITLKFLGDIPSDRLDSVRAGVREAVETIAPFQLTLGRVGAFPNLDRPRVLWLDVEDGGNALIDLQSRVETALCTRRFVREERPFSPHLTIGRVRSPKGVNGLTALMKQIPFQTPELHIDRVAIIKSELRPGGPVYTVLEHAELG